MYKGSKAEELTALITSGQLEKARVVVDQQGNVLCNYDLNAMAARREEQVR